MSDEEVKADWLNPDLSEHSIGPLPKLYSHSICIGLGATGQAEGDIVFKAGDTELRFTKDGEIFICGRLVANDTEIVEGFRTFLQKALNVF